MGYTKEELLAALGAADLHERIFDRYDETMAEYDSRGVYFLCDEFLDRIEEKHRFLGDKLPLLKAAALGVRENELCARYSLLLYRMLERNRGLPIIRLTDRPKSDDPGLLASFRMAAYFALLATAPSMMEEYDDRGIPDKIRRDTALSCYYAPVGIDRETGSCSFNDDVSFWWNQHYANLNIFRIGALNFQINLKFERKVSVFKSNTGEYALMPDGSDVAGGGHIAGSAGYPDADFFADVKEDSESYSGYPIDTGEATVGGERVTLPKSRWKRILKPGDTVIGIHISADSKITPENCRRAFSECTDFLKCSFPEYKPNAFSCASWLLDPTLSKMLPESANIVTFGKHFLRFPVCSGGKSVFTFLFRGHFDSYEDLPERTTLERAVKAHYIKGNYIYDTGGVFFGYGI